MALINGFCEPYNYSFCKEESNKPAGCDNKNVMHKLVYKNKGIYFL